MIMKKGKYKIDSDENSDFMYNVIREIVTKIGPRPSGSENEKKTAELIKSILENYCDETHIEHFNAYPRAFLGWFKIVIPMIILSYFVYFLSDLITPFVTSLIGLSLTLLALFILYKHFLSYEIWTPKIFPYKEKQSQNVVGIIKPKKNPKKRVVLSAHMDSCFRFSLIEYTRQGYVYFIASGILGVAQFILIHVSRLIYVLVNWPEKSHWTYFVNWIIVIVPFFMTFFIFVMGQHEKIFYGSFRKMDKMGYITIIGCLTYSMTVVLAFYRYLMTDPTLIKSAGILMIVSVPYLVGLFFYLSKHSNNSAIDNLTAVAPCICAAKILKEYQEKYQDKFPNETEVVIAIVGSEEVGLIGSYNFAKRHAEEYNKIDTTCINLESLEESRYQRIYMIEETTKTELSPEVYEPLAKCSEELGIETHLRGMPGIAGGTDATGLVRGGLKATSIEGINYKDYMYWYHSTRDNIDMINKERRPCMDVGKDWKHRNIRCAMENALKTILLYIEKKDKGEI
ncbi:MAG: M28 family peptidase [Candidatus Lokiarchaeota archaeon]|nr:M28 family peptidase [Candidatus Lokiarchaeota archaeon]